MKTRFLSCVVLCALVAASLISCNKHTSPTEPTPVCTYTVSPATAALGSDGGTGTVTVTAPDGCSWNAAASVDWVTITAGASGTGNGSVTYSVGANMATTSRAGTITIGGQSYAIAQQGRSATACSYDLSPGGANVSKDGGSGTFRVTAPADCAWTARTDVSWLSVTGGAQGSGTATVTYTVARHSEIAERSGTITVGDLRFIIRQSGDVSVCQYSVAPVVLTPCMAGGAITATITTQASCPWTATPNAEWLKVSSESAGTGSATVSISFTDNYDAPREGIVMVRWPTPTAGQNIRVAQAGCRYGVSRTAIDTVAAGGSSSFDVIQQSDPTTCGGATQDRCVWTARSEVPWITITSSMPRSGDNPVAFTVATNGSTTARVGRIVVRDQAVTVTQAGK